MHADMQLRKHRGRHLRKERKLHELNRFLKSTNNDVISFFFVKNSSKIVLDQTYQKHYFIDELTKCTMKPLV